MTGPALYDFKRKVKNNRELLEKCKRVVSAQLKRQNLQSHTPVRGANFSYLNSSNKKLALKKNLQDVFKKIVIRKIVTGRRGNSFNVNTVEKNYSTKRLVKGGLNPHVPSLKQNVYNSTIAAKVFGGLVKMGKKKKALKCLHFALLLLAYKYKFSPLALLNEVSAKCRPVFLLRRFILRQKIEEYPVICKKQQRKKLPIK